MATNATGILSNTRLWMRMTIRMPTGVSMLLINALAILLLYKCKSLNSFFRIHLVSMALSDLLLGTTLICTALIYCNYDVFSETMNIFTYGLYACATIVSALNVVAIALDRCLRMKFPITYTKKVTSRRTIYLTVGIWICSSSAAYVSCQRFFKYPINGMCPEEYILRYPPITPAALYIICLLVVIGCYTYVIVRIRRQRRVWTSHGLPVSLNTMQRLGARSSASTVEYNGRDLVLSQIVKTSFLLTTLFTVCFLPFVITSIYVLSHPSTAHSDVVSNMYMIARILIVTNSLLNPIFYMTNVQELRTIIKRLFSRQHPIAPTVATANDGRQAQPHDESVV